MGNLFAGIFFGGELAYLIYIAIKKKWFLRFWALIKRAIINIANMPKRISAARKRARLANDAPAKRNNISQGFIMVLATSVFTISIWAQTFLYFAYTCTSMGFRAGPSEYIIAGLIIAFIISVITSWGAYFLYKRCFLSGSKCFISGIIACYIAIFSSLFTAMAFGFYIFGSYTKIYGYEVLLYSVVAFFLPPVIAVAVTGVMCLQALLYKLLGKGLAKFFGRNRCS